MPWKILEVFENPRDFTKFLNAFVSPGDQALHAATLALCRAVGVLVGRVAPGCWLGATRPTCRGGHLSTLAKPLDGRDELGGLGGLGGFHTVLGRDSGG